ncbi:CBS domain-containing protein [Photobacterium kishitanii]|uniref:CBS domain-containing protein n=1 Tax=Photobacterium kishitanii TaxID=318456 RepID=UPI00273908B5|nr:CBS domain-containing protein [Photobacterium kishitanii]
MSETLIPNIIEFMATVDPFDKLTPKTLRDVAGMITIRYFGKGEVIDLQESDQLYLLRTGAVEQRNLDGTLRARLAAEDFFGFSRLTQAETNTASDPYTITVIEDALIYCLPINALLLKLKDQPDALAHFGSHAQSRLQSGLNVVWSQHEKGLFFKPIIDVLNSQIVLVESTQTIQAVAKAMRVNANSSCAFIMQNNQFVGLITDKDMTKRVVAEGISTTEMITASHDGKSL